MKLKKLEHKLTVCKVADIKDVDTDKDFYFIGNPKILLNEMMDGEDSVFRVYLIFLL